MIVVIIVMHVSDKEELPNKKLDGFDFEADIVCDELSEK